MSTQLLSIAEAGERIGVSTKTIRRRIAEGALPAYRVGTSIIRLKPADVDALLRPIPTGAPAA